MLTSNCDLTGRSPLDRLSGVNATILLNIDCLQLSFGTDGLVPTLLRQWYVRFLNLPQQLIGGLTLTS